MLRALYADFDACFEHYMYILKALLKALKRDSSSIIRPRPRLTALFELHIMQNFITAAVKLLCTVHCT